MPRLIRYKLHKVKKNTHSDFFDLLPTDRPLEVTQIDGVLAILVLREVSRLD